MQINLVAHTSGRLDQVLLELAADQLKGLSRSQLKNQIEAGAVSVNGRVVLKAGSRIDKGDRIELISIAQREDTLEPYQFELEILHEDEDLIVINKPPGISMHPGAGDRTKTLANALQARFGGSKDFGALDRAGIVHRLDKDTSGVIVVAKNKLAQAGLSEQFASRTIERLYLALALSGPRTRREVDTNDQGRIETRLGRDPKNRLKIAVLKDKGRVAITNWRVLKRLAYANLLELKLETGRTHQIRVHLAYLGSPIIGDKLYAGNLAALPNELRRASDEFGRQALHASTLGFIHPRTEKQLSFKAEAPKDFKELLEQFELFRG